jgi:hypothetical protein
MEPTALLLLLLAFAAMVSIRVAARLIVDTRRG